MTSPSDNQAGDLRMPRAGKRVFLTGIEGFTGRYIVPVLRERGYTVCGIRTPDPSPSARYPARADVHDCDLNDKSALRRILEKENPDYVLHFAGISSATHADKREIYNVNLLGTLSLLEALKESGCAPSKVVLAGSAQIYGNQPVPRQTEALAPLPYNDYAVSKLAVEHLARLWSGQFPVIVTRPFNYTGAGQSENFLLPKIVRHFALRLPEIELGNIHIARDWSDVRDVAGIYVALMESDARDEVVNICSGKARSIADILSMMEEISGHRLSIRVNPSFVRAQDAPVLEGSDEKLNRLVPGLTRRPLIDTLAWMYGECCASVAGKAAS